MLHSLHIALFSCCTFFVLHTFGVAIFPCCTFFILYSFHVSPFCVLRYFYLVLFHVAPCFALIYLALTSGCTFLSCTHFVFQFFHVALFHFELFSGCIFLLLHTFLAAFFLYFCMFLLHVPLISCCIFSVFALFTNCSLFMLRHFSRCTSFELEFSCWILFILLFFRILLFWYWTFFGCTVAFFCVLLCPCFSCFLKPQ